MNPYLVLRTHTGRTQEYIADLADVTVQTIHRLESGLVNSPIEEIFWLYTELISTEEMQEVLLKNVPPVFHDGDPKRLYQMFEAWYQWWQAAERGKIAEELKEAGFELPPPGLSPTKFRMWVMSYLEPFSDAGSLNAFCRKFKLHPFTVQSWENRRGHAPPTVVIALADAGISLEGYTFG